MILKLRQRMAQEESGFTLVELLVVMLILGLLAAIAIPAFFNQRDKAKDASAKEAVRTAETAMETYSTDNGGKYNAGAATGAVTVADLVKIEPTLSNPTLLTPVVGTSAGPPADSSDNSYTVTVQSSTGNYFSITRHATGTISLKCGDAVAAGLASGGTGSAGCPTGGNWAQ